MITIKLIGGLGNQMFQYALYAALQEKGLECNIDDSYKHENGSSIVERSDRKSSVCKRSRPKN